MVQISPTFQLDPPQIRRLHRVTATTGVIAVLFFLFFQVNKGGPFREINPFGVDPYDAVGSIAIQVALAIGILNYGRALRIWSDAEQTGKARLVLRGDALVLLAVLVTLAADWVAVSLHPISLSGWGALLLGELTALSLLVLAAAASLAGAARRIRTPTPPTDLTPADGIDDLWTLVKVPGKLMQRRIPARLQDWIETFTSDRFFRRAAWLDPRRHPWRFAALLGLVVGVAILLAQLQEGLPPSLEIGLVVAVIFIGVEFSATLAGFALLGGFLGLRPAFQPGKPGYTRLEPRLKPRLQLRRKPRHKARH